MIKNIGITDDGKVWMEIHANYTGPELKFGPGTPLQLLSTMSTEDAVNVIKAIEMALGELKYGRHDSSGVDKVSVQGDGEAGSRPDAKR